MCPAVETLSVPPSETQSSSVWLIVGVVVPVLLAVFIIIILYWKLCGSEKLEFQPDAINTIQQRQKVSSFNEESCCIPVMSYLQVEKLRILDASQLYCHVDRK